MKPAFLGCGQEARKNMTNPTDTKEPSLYSTSLFYNMLFNLLCTVVL